MLPYVPPDPNQITIIDPGIPVSVVVVTTVNQANVTVIYRFGFSPSPARNALQVDYSVTGLALTVCTAFLQQSFDGGVTFQDVGAVVDLFANPQGSLMVFFAVGSLVTSPIYRFRIATLTTTSMVVNLAVS